MSVCYFDLQLFSMCQGKREREVFGVLQQPVELFYSAETLQRPVKAIVEGA